MDRKWSAAFLGTALAAIAALLGGCGGDSSGSSSGVSGADQSPLVARTDPPNNGAVYLNQPIRVEFTQEIDLGSVDSNSFAFSAYDLFDNHAATEAVFGEFRYQVVGGAVDRRVIEFLPALPTNDTFDNGGVRPGRLYHVHIPGADARGLPVIRSMTGRPIAQGFVFCFSTPMGRGPKELFLDRVAGGPKKLSLSPSGTIERLNFFLGSDLEEVRLVFDQPLNPASTNFNQGRIFLEYDDPGLDPLGATRIRAELRLARNLPDRAEASLIPLGLLPSNAEIRVIVEPELQDLSGQSNVGDPAHDRVFGTFRTDPALGFQYDAIVADFSDPWLQDMEAPHREPPADWKAGRLKAALEFGGSAALFDFEPVHSVSLDTVFTQVIPKQGVPITVYGGVFSFRNITIPKGILVQASGSNPLVLLATGEVNVHGRIIADGGNGTPVNTLNAANWPALGGAGACGGGAGGTGSPSLTNSSAQGEDGCGPWNRTGGGGKGGHTGYGGGAKGAGGGGGSFTTQGDPEYLSSAFLHMTGAGGDGGGTDAVTRMGVPKGGQPGPVVFTDADPNNDFCGRDVRLVGGRETVVLGELKAPTGGQGGGGGGDLVPMVFPTGPSFSNDNKGGGGGGGGGIVIIKALGRVIVWETGQITAKGGDGGGGEQAGSNNQGGGGAGGSGGMVVIQSAIGIEIKMRPPAWSAPSLFGISADGGVGFNGSFSGGRFESKYPPRNVGSVNRGGFGGLGLVQLMAPNPTTDIMFTTGQVKPSPVLLPSDFGYLSRVRSRWIDTGASARQTTRPSDPRYLDNGAEPGKRGPEYRFAGLHTGGAQLGYLDYRTTASGPGGAGGWVHCPELAAGTLESAIPAGASSFHTATAQGAVLGAQNALRGARFQIVQGGTVAGEWLVLGNTAATLFLAAAGETPFTASLAGSAFRVVAKYLDVWTAGRPGLPIRVAGQEAFPSANIRIGFAACSRLDENGTPVDRYPAAEGHFVYDLETAGAREALWKDSQGRHLARPLVLFDVLFNLAYDPANPAVPLAGASLAPDAQLPELRFLVLPFRF